MDSEHVLASIQTYADLTADEMDKVREYFRTTPNVTLELVEAVAGYCARYGRAAIQPLFDEPQRIGNNTFWIETNPPAMFALHIYGLQMQEWAENMAALLGEAVPKIADVLAQLPIEQENAPKKKRPVLTDPRMRRGKGGKLKWRRE